jgi:hypothetical protein
MNENEILKQKIIFRNTKISKDFPYIWGEKFQKLKVKWTLFST